MSHLEPVEPLLRPGWRFHRRPPALNGGTPLGRGPHV